MAGLRGVADVLFLGAMEHNGTVAAERAVHEQPPDFLGILRADGLGAPALVQIRLHQRHAVLRERARFVRADHGSAAQRFHGRQAADDGVFLHHALYADGKHDGHNGGQTLGDG